MLAYSYLCTTKLINAMKKLILSLFVACLALTASAEDGHQLWLRYQPVNKAKVTTPKQTPVINVARQELETYFQGESVTLKLDTSLPDNDGFTIDVKDGKTTITARQESGLLYGAYDLLRRQTITGLAPITVHSAPAFNLRLLNHWDNPDGSIERGYAGESIFEWFKLDEQMIREYARANASIGINGSVLNNVNASPKMLTTEYLKEVKKIAGSFLTLVDSLSRPIARDSLALATIIVPMPRVPTCWLMP